MHEFKLDTARLSSRASARLSQLFIRNIVFSSTESICILDIMKNIDTYFNGTTETIVNFQIHALTNENLHNNVVALFFQRKFRNRQPILIRIY